MSDDINQVQGGQGQQQVGQQIVQADYTGAPEFHVDGLGGLSVRNGVAKLNFFSVRHNRSGGAEPQGALTIDISILDLVAMANGLNNAVQQFQKQGLITIGRNEETPQEG